MFRAILSCLFISSLLAQKFDAYNFPTKLEKQQFSIDKIIKGHGGWTFYIDLDSRMVASKSSVGGFYFTGGFGDSYNSFIDPIGFSISNLDFYIFDKSQNKVFRFDYSLNLINSLDLSTDFDRSSILVDDFEIDNWGNYYLFSKNNNAIIRGNISGIDPLIFIDLDQQIIDKDCCEKIKINSVGDIALLYPCSKQLVIFNRLGRLKYKLKFLIDDVMTFTDIKDSWAVFNNQGKIEVFDKSTSKQFLIPLIDNEYLIDISRYNYKLSSLTNQRIIEFYLDK
ncbi:MAG: hypothetical protein ACJZ1O_06800 [Candidatus Neomarinimicrobiota bacterium]